MFNTPILFDIFNRPGATQKVFDAIRQQKPKYLYVHADGPRKHKPQESEICQQVRDIIKVDWDCELKTLFQNENLGCKIAESTAITWFFENVEQGIILSDDCLPHPSFFPYCEELLEKYKDDTRIGHISGDNFLHTGIIEPEFSYDFCFATHIWGWATWRRVWKNYDVNFPFWSEQKGKRSFLFYNKWDEIYHSTFISDVLNNRNGINTWDEQYVLTLRLQNQLSIYPAVNLVTNIGLGDPNAVHTAKKNNKLSIPVSELSFPLKHPQYVLRNKNLDNMTSRKLFFSWKRLIKYFFNAIS